LYERALAINEQVLGAEHPYTATSLQNLAMNAYYEENWDIAWQLIQKAHRIHEQRFGLHHAYTESSRQSLLTIEQRIIEVIWSPVGIAQILQLADQAETAVEEMLDHGSDVQRAALVIQFDIAAQEIAEGQPPGSPWLALTVYLRILKTRLEKSEQLSQSNAKKGRSPGSPWLALAAHLRMLKARLEKVTRQGNVVPRNKYIRQRE
jgi:hypothetical protein